MSKERDIQVLEFKIAEIDRLITEYQAHGISQKKIERLEILKLMYEDSLAELQLA